MIIRKQNKKNKITEEKYQLINGNQFSYYIVYLYTEVEINLSHLVQLFCK